MFCTLLCCIDSSNKWCAVQGKPSNGKSSSETDVSPLKQLYHPQGVPACCVACFCADMHLCQTPMMCHRVVSVSLVSMARSARCICIMLDWYMPIRFCRQCCLGHKMASVLCVTCSAGSAKASVRSTGTYGAPRALAVCSTTPVAMAWSWHTTRLWTRSRAEAVAMAARTTAGGHSTQIA